MESPKTRSYASISSAREASPQHLGGFAARILPRRDDIRADGERDVGTDAQAAVIRLEGETLKHRGRPAKSDDDLGARHRQTLSGPDVEGYALPAPGIDPQSQGDKRLHWQSGDALSECLRGSPSGNAARIREATSFAGHEQPGRT